MAIRRKERIDAFVTPVTSHRRAIVIGDGIAGLLAGRVLTDHFDQVVLKERKYVYLGLAAQIEST